MLMKCLSANLSLDALHMHIFTAVRDIEAVLLILGLCLLPDLDICPSMDIGELKHFFLLSKGNFEVLFGDLSLLIIISSVKAYIHLLHASLEDFLRDPARSKEFYIDLSSIHIYIRRNYHKIPYLRRISAVATCGASLLIFLTSCTGEKTSGGGPKPCI